MSDSIPVQYKADPPAAAVVIHGTKSEREAALEKELQEEREKRKQREIEIAHIQDVNLRLKQAGVNPPPPPPAAPRAGWTFFDEND